MADYRMTPEVPALLCAAQTGRLKLDTDRRRFLLNDRYPDTDVSDTITAMHEDALIVTDRAADEPGVVLMKPTSVGWDVLDAAMEG